MVHGLAVNYHWSEEEIYNLPFVRLRAYQNELLRERGKALPDDEPESEELARLQEAMIEVMRNR